MIVSLRRRNGASASGTSDSNSNRLSARHIQRRRHPQGGTPHSQSGNRGSVRIRPKTESSCNAFFRRKAETPWGHAFVPRFMMLLGFGAIGYTARRSRRAEAKGPRLSGALVEERKAGFLFLAESPFHLTCRSPARSAFRPTADINDGAIVAGRTPDSEALFRIPRCSYVLRRFRLAVVADLVAEVGPMP
jgi:hypothetical protein